MPNRGLGGLSGAGDLDGARGDADRALTDLANVPAGCGRGGALIGGVAAPGSVPVADV